MDRTDPAYDEYLSSGIDPTGGELEEESAFKEKKYYSVCYFRMKGVDQRAIDVFEKFQVPYWLNTEFPSQPNQFAVEETADEPHPIYQALKESGADIQLLMHEPIHRLQYQHAWEELYGEGAK